MPGRDDDADGGGGGDDDDRDRGPPRRRVFDPLGGGRAGPGDGPRMAHLAADDPLVASTLRSMIRRGGGTLAPGTSSSSSSRRGVLSSGLDWLARATDDSGGDRGDDDDDVAGIGRGGGGGRERGGDGGGARGDVESGQWGELQRAWERLRADGGGADGERATPSSGGGDDGVGEDGGAPTDAAADLTNSAAFRSATRWLEHTVPVLLLLLLAHFASHAKAICVYAFFFVVLTRCDAYLRARVGKTKRGDDGGGGTAGGTAGGGADASPAGAAVALTVVLLSHLTLLRTMYPTDAFWGRVFLFTLPSGDGADDPAAWGFARWGTDADGAAPGFVDATWRTCAVDLVLKYVAMVVKAGTYAATAHSDGGRRRSARGVRGGGPSRWRWRWIREFGRKERGAGAGGDGDVGGGDPPPPSSPSPSPSSPKRQRLANARRRAVSRSLAARLSFIENASLTYRCVAPTPVWFAYFASRSTFGGAFAGCYLLFKARATHERVVAAIAAWRAMARAHDGHGARASPADVAEAGDRCAICQERFDDPVKLACEHVFCDGCVGEWFERERTCPLCRASVGGAGAGARPYGDGGTVMIGNVF